MPRTLKNFVLVAIALVCLNNYLHAQTLSITGRVTDNNKQPVPYASVVLSEDSLSKIGIAYAVTNDQGQFSITNIKPNPDSRWLSVRSMGYENYLKNISIKSIKSPLYITLPVSTVDLEEVVVIKAAPDAYLKGDTLIFNTENYRLGNERSLADVVRKMPVMQVDATGNVSYQGQRISKILVNGKDILANSSGVAMNTLSPDFANSVELLQNYTADDIAHAFRASEQMAINLKTDKKVAISGTIEGSGGLKNKFMGKAALLSVLPKLSTSLMLNANNTGKALFSLEDYLLNLMDLDAVQNSGPSTQKLTLSADETELINPPANENKRNAGLGNLNLTWSPTDNYRLRSTTLLNGSQSTGSTINDETYILPDTLFDNKLHKTIDKATWHLSQNINQKWTPSRQISLSARTNLDMRKHQTENLQNNIFGANEMNALEKPKKNVWNIRQNIDMKLLLGQGYTYFGASADYSNNKNNQLIYTDTALLPVRYINDENEKNFPLKIDCHKNGKYFTINGFAGAIFPIFGKIMLKGELNVEQNNNSHKITNGDSLVGTEDLNLRTLKPYIGLMKNSGLFRFNLGSNFSWYQLNTNNLSFKPDKAFAAEPTISIELMFSNLHRLKLSTNYGLEPTSLDLLSQVPSASRYNHLLRASELTKRFAKSSSASLFYFYYSLFNRLTLLAQANYTRKDDTYLNVNDGKGLMSSTLYRNGGKSQTYNATVNLSKGLGTIPMDLKLRTQYVGSTLNMIRFESDEVINTQIVTGTMELVSRFLHIPFNFELAGHLSHSLSEFQKSNLSSWNREMGCNATLHWDRNKFAMSLTGKFNRTQNASRKHDFVDMDVSMKYSLKKFDIWLIANDLLHINKNEWMEEELSATLKSRALFRRMPGYLLLMLSWRI